jgi:hypothetical protein
MNVGLLHEYGSSAFVCLVPVSDLPGFWFNFAEGRLQNWIRFFSAWSEALIGSSGGFE